MLHGNLTAVQVVRYHALPPALITQHFIREQGSAAMVVEADRPDAYHVHCYTQAREDSRDADQGRAVEYAQRDDRAAMFEHRVTSWNLRDQYMSSTLDGRHNPNLGDARDTEVAQRGQINLERLVRERHAGEAVYWLETERLSRYFEAHLSDQIAAIHFDEATAVRPLGARSPQVSEEVPEHPAGV